MLPEGLTAARQRRRVQASLGLGIQPPLPPQLVLPRTRYERQVRERRWKALRIGPDSTQYQGGSASWQIAGPSTQGLPRYWGYQDARQARQGPAAANSQSPSPQRRDMDAVKARNGSPDDVSRRLDDCGFDVANDDDLRIDISVHSPGTGVFISKACSEPLLPVCVRVCVRARARVSV